MRLKAINWIFMACLATALTSETEPRPRRHLHDIKLMIANKLFGRNEPNCTQPQPSQPGTRFFRIPGFNDVVIKAVPKGSVTPPPLIEKIPPNSHIGVVGSYLGTNTPNETYNALLGVKNLFKSGILEAKQGALRKITLLKSTTPKPVTPCPSPEPVYPPIVEPIGIVVKPPKVPDATIVAPTRYSYKQVNQDGSVTTWSSYLDFNQGVKVTDGGKTFPFIFDRIRKIPVQLPVPVLPEVSKILIPNDGNFRRYPVKVIQPDSFYSYQQMNHDGSLTPYTDLPSLYNKYDGPVVETEPFIYEAPAFESSLLASAPEYSYTQASGAFSAPPLSVFPIIPEKNPFGPPAPHYTPYSYNQQHSGVRVANYAGPMESGVQEQGADFSASEPLAFGVQPPGHNLFSYIQANDDKVTSNNEAELNNHPAPPHITERTENVAAESAPQKPVKPPSASVTSPFLYKYVHHDGSVTSFGGDGSINEGLNYHMPTPAMSTPQGNTRVFESPIYTGPFPIDVNTNAFKPSLPVSGSYSYKLLNNGQEDYHYDIGPNEAFQTPGLAGNEPFPVPPVFLDAPAPVQGCVDPDSQSYPNPMVAQSSSFNPGYSYSQTGYHQPNTFSTINAENPAMTANNVNIKISDGNQHRYYSNAFQNFNEDYHPNPKDYVYIPPARYDEIPPPIKPLNLPRLPPKKFSNRFLYENFDGYNFRDENSNQPSSTIKPLESSADNVYDEGSLDQVQYNRRSILSNRNSITDNLVPDLVSEQGTVDIKPADSVFEQAPFETPFDSQTTLSNRNPVLNYPTAAPEQVSLLNNPVVSIHNEQIPIQTPSSSKPILSQQSSLTANPIMVQENTSFLFKQSNSDGSSITTTNDGGNTLSVQVEEARKPEAIQGEESMGNVDETPSPVDEALSIVTAPVPVVVVEESAEPEPAPSTELPRRRIIKRVRVKHRGDIPDSD